MDESYPAWRCKQKQVVSDMALAVDRFEYLAREIIATLTSARDVLAAVGTLYAASKSVSVLSRLFSTLKTFGLAPSWRGDYKRHYGHWAGWWACLPST